MDHGKFSREVKDRNFQHHAFKDRLHMVMIMQCEVKDFFGGRQVWRCPSTLTTKLVQWQSLAAKQDTGKSHGHQTRR
jgi:hypothetical protein